MAIGWVIFIIIIVLAVILSNILLLKHSANMKMPESVLKAIEQKKQLALETKQKQEAESNKQQ